MGAVCRGTATHSLLLCCATPIPLLPWIMDSIPVTRGHVVVYLFHVETMLSGDEVELEWAAELAEARLNDLPLLGQQGVGSEAVEVALLPVTIELARLAHASPVPTETASTVSEGDQTAGAFVATGVPGLMLLRPSEHRVQDLMRWAWAWLQLNVFTATPVLPATPSRIIRAYTAMELAMDAQLMQCMGTGGQVLAQYQAADPLQWTDLQDASCPPGMRAMALRFYTGAEVADSGTSCSEADTSRPAEAAMGESSNEVPMGVDGVDADRTLFPIPHSTMQSLLRLTHAAWTDAGHATGGAVSLEDCLEEACRLQLLDSDSSWQCHHCNSSVQAEKGMHLTVLPDTFIVVRSAASPLTPLPRNPTHPTLQRRPAPLQSIVVFCSLCFVICRPDHPSLRVP